MKEQVHNSWLNIVIVLAMSMNIVRSVELPQKKIEQKSALDLTILHNNDMHARFEQTDKYSAICNYDEMIANKCYGGFARVSYLLKQYRDKAETGGPPVLYLNAGDTYTGTPWFAIYKDRIVTEFMNILKPDAISLGNHELDLGVDGLVPFLKGVDFPVLVANINNSADHVLWQTRALKKSVVFDIKGFKVGVVGYLTPETKQVTIPNDLIFIPEITAINTEAEVLKKRNVNIIIALGHSGYEVDKEIAKNCPHVDIVIGGHSHTFLYSGPQPDIEQAYGPYPTVIKQDSGKEVPVVQAYAFTKYLGELELSFDEHGNLIRWGGKPILLNGSVPRDPEVLRLLEKYRPAVSELFETKYGLTKVRVDGLNCRKSECNAGNMITDAYIYTRLNQYNGPYWTDASIALLQGGGIRSAISSGDISKFALKTMLPFNDTLFVVNVTGSILMQMLEHSVQHYTGDRGQFMQMSGLRVVYDMSKEPGHRVQSAEALCAQCEIPSYSLIDLNKEYGVIISDFLYNGGDGYTIFKNLKKGPINVTEFDSVTRYIQDMRIVYPKLEGRIKLLNLKKLDGPASGSTSHSIVPVSMILFTVFTLFIYNTIGY